MRRLSDRDRRRHRPGQYSRRPATRSLRWRPSPTQGTNGKTSIDVPRAWIPRFLPINRPKRRKRLNVDATVTSPYKKRNPPDGENQMSKGRAIVRSLPTHCRGNVHGFGDENKGFGSRERKTSDKQLGAGHKEAGVSGRSAPASADRSVDRPPPQLGSALGRETPEHLCRARRRASSFSKPCFGSRSRRSRRW